MAHFERSAHGPPIIQSLQQLDTGQKWREIKQGIEFQSQITCQSLVMRQSTETLASMWTRYFELGVCRGFYVATQVVAIIR